MPNGLSRLRWHIDGTSSADDERNFADCVWMAKHCKPVESLKTIWSDVLPELELLNSQLNGTVSAESIHRSVAYVISGFIAGCCDIAMSDDCPDVSRRSFLEFGWKLSVAWEAILAGDIKEIGVHVSAEEWAR